ncbi:DinB family protein [Chitinophaga niabensis]|uniref:DinB family protein n=1 Tax=Chitinophaga niabensis TaxID=536979 RepID=UPI0031B9AE94
MLQIPIATDTRLRTQHLALEDITGEVAQDVLEERVREGKWTALENAAHLVAFQLVFKARIQKMLNEDDPTFAAYSGDTDPVFLSYCKLSNAELLSIYRKERTELIRLVDSIDPEDLSRTGKHMKYGVFNIPGWLEMFLLHEAHHLFTIIQLIHTPGK